MISAFDPVIVRLLTSFLYLVWEWDQDTQEYYLHLFCPEQPDLNWENPETRAAIYESAMEFWLRKGVDGFRIDTVNMYSKDPGLRDAPIIDPEAEWQFAAEYYCNGPHMHIYLREMNQILSKYRAMTVGELPHTPDVQKVLKYVSARERQLNMVFQFDLVDLGFNPHQKYDTVPRAWTLHDLRDAVAGTQSLMEGTDAWTTAFLENHDQARSITRFGCDRTPELRNRSGKMLAMLLATISGTLYLYQGQEIGLVNAPESWDMSEYKDIESNSFYNYVRDKTGDDPAALTRTKKALQHLARDHARLPMQWDGTRHGGFTTGESTWMRVNDDYPEVNVKRQTLDQSSVLNFWKRMLRLRKEFADIFIKGTFRPLDEANESVLVFEKRATNGKAAMVVLNFTENEQAHPELRRSGMNKLAGNYEGDGNGALRPFEGVVYV
jgi:alpha-glucosidase/glucan 1,6-alpha-glucosidase